MSLTGGGARSIVPPMSRTLYYGSGSPYAWKVWLTLEHKALPFALKLLSFDRGETQTPEYLALSPRGKVPALVDGELVLTESTAIVEYLEERYPERPLLPRDLAARAHVRRIGLEADAYFAPAVRGCRGVVFERAGATPEAIAAAREGVVRELERFAAHLGERPYFGGEALTLADFTLYPHLRLLLRFDERAPELGIAAALPAGLRAWAGRIDALPYTERTTPPHWKG